MTRKAKFRWLILLVPVALWGLSVLAPGNLVGSVSGDRVVGVRSAHGFVGIGFLHHSLEIPPEETGERTLEEWLEKVYGSTPEVRLGQFLDEARGLPFLQFFDVADVEARGHPYRSKVVYSYVSARYLVRWSLICLLVGLGLLCRIAWQKWRSGS